VKGLYTGWVFKGGRQHTRFERQIGEIYVRQIDLIFLQLMFKVKSGFDSGSEFIRNFLQDLIRTRHITLLTNITAFTTDSS
jgi:hypothetical protein